MTHELAYDPTSDPSIDLLVGETYTPDQLSELFGFKPYYLRTAGGMCPSARAHPATPRAKARHCGA